MTKPEPETLYKSIAATHTLPPYETICALFDIESIDTEAKNPLREIAKKIFEHTDTVRKVLEGIQQPDASIISMIEAEMLTDIEHEQLMKVLRIVMQLDRQLLHAELMNDDRLYAHFIVNGCQHWPTVQTTLGPIIQKISAGWPNPQTMKLQQGYLG